MTPKTNKDIEWHYIHITGLGDAWVGWGIAKNQTVMDKHGKPFEAFPSQTARPISPYADEEPWVREILEADDRDELKPMTKAQVKALFKPTKGTKAAK